MQNNLSFWTRLDSDTGYQGSVRQVHEKKYIVITIDA